MFVTDIMSTCIPECTEDMGLEEVFELIQKCDHGLVVVIDSLAHRVPIGVVTERSICQQIITRGRNPKGLAAGSVIDSRIRKVDSSQRIDDICEESTADLAAIVVVDDNRRACGLISKEKLTSFCSIANQRYILPSVVARSAEPSSNREHELLAIAWIQ